MNSNTTILLLAAALNMIGFIPGCVTGPKPPMAAGHFAVLKHMSEGDMTALGGSDEVCQSLEEGDFEGDTVFAIPGGQVHMVKNGEDVEFEAEMTETSVNEWVEKDDDRVITKHIIVTMEDCLPAPQRAPRVRGSDAARVARGVWCCGRIRGIFTEKVKRKTYGTMKTGTTFGFFATIATAVLMSCGGGADSAVTTDGTADMNACECLVEMNAALQSVLGDENNANWSAKQWTQELAKASSACMSKMRTPQELSVWSQEQSGCEGYATYKELVGSFRAKMVAAKGEGTEMPRNIKDISEEGAKGLLDELSKQR